MNTENIPTPFTIKNDQAGTSPTAVNQVQVDVIPDDTPEDFKQGMAEIERGELVDLDVALNTPPPSPSAMEATPLTDALSYKCDAIDVSHDVVDSDDVRKIERQLTACKAALAKEREEHLRTSERLVAADKAYMIELESNETSRTNEQKLADEAAHLREVLKGSNINCNYLSNKLTRERAVRRELARITQWMRDRYEHGIKLLAHNQTPGAGELIADAEETLQQVDAVLAASRALDADKPHGA